MPGQTRPIRRARRRLTVQLAAAAISVAVLSGVAGCGQALTANTGQSAAATNTSAPAMSPTGTPAGQPKTTSAPPASAKTPPVAGARPGTALAALSTLAVRPAASMSGYSRAQFGAAWSDDNSDPDGHNGCDTRNDILRRDLVDLVMKAGTGGCTVASGVLHDPYGGTSISFVRGPDSAVIQIDHVVALGDAWTTGAATSVAAALCLGRAPHNRSRFLGSESGTLLCPHQPYRRRRARQPPNGGGTARDAVSAGPHLDVANQSPDPGVSS
jgi:hypothetical protein